MLIVACLRRQGERLPWMLAGWLPVAPATGRCCAPSLQHHKTQHVNPRFGNFCLFGLKTWFILFCFN